MSQSDIFEGDLAFGSAQRTLFEGGKLDAEPSASRIPDPADIRRRLGGVLDKVRRADRMPWNPRDARMWQTVFPQMANWLPADEADQLRLEFARELERLGPLS